MAKAGKVTQDEDTRILVTIQPLNKLGHILDCDLGSYEVITMKAMIWTATFCMLHQSEYCKSDRRLAEQTHNALLKENITLLPDGLSVTFLSWKGHMGAKTLFFLFM